MENLIERFFVIFSIRTWKKNALLRSSNTPLHIHDFHSSFGEERNDFIICYKKEVA